MMQDHRAQLFRLCIIHEAATMKIMQSNFPFYPYKFFHVILRTLYLPLFFLCGQIHFLIKFSSFLIQLYQSEPALHFEIRGMLVEVFFFFNYTVKFTYCNIQFYCDKESRVGIYQASGIQSTSRKSHQKSCCVRKKGGSLAHRPFSLNIETVLSKLRGVVGHITSIILMFPSANPLQLTPSPILNP